MTQGQMQIKRHSDAEITTQDKRLLLVLGVTGAGALAMEVIWSRRLVPWVGGTAFAQIATVGTYMLGLFLGAAAGIPAAKRSRDPRKIFLLAECGAAVFGLFFATIHTDDERFARLCVTLLGISV